MTSLTPLDFAQTDFDALQALTGRIAVLADPEGDQSEGLSVIAARSDGAVERLMASEAFKEAKPGAVETLAFPAGLATEALDVVVLPADCSVKEARKAGAALAKRRGKHDLALLAEDHPMAAEIAFGLLMRDYTFEDHKSEPKPREGAVTVMCGDPDAVKSATAPLIAVAEGAHFTRDLVNAPANVLTTTSFAERLQALEETGLKVEVLDEEELASLGMRTLLCVGQGSDSPSKVVVMRWEGGTEGTPPLALVGKGVVFDTGGISLKPGAGMEDMTMDMGGAGVVAGVMKALALRGAKANVVGLVGLVENMPSGNATRPGDVITSMKGDTVEVINTDAEGRLVLCDVMWYAQERFKPGGMIDLATLTGAMIIALGHENAGAFSNHDDFCDAFLKAAGEENEGVWRMPLGKAYDKLLKSRIADMKNIGGRGAGSITAAQFLHRFVKEETPWIHLDIAGVASVKSETALAPSGATGWGVAALNRLVADEFEGK
ncbi:MAG: leucyl aminopeptidase [Pseudomonadota bacterium]